MWGVSKKRGKTVMPFQDWLEKLAVSPLRLQEAEETLRSLGRSFGPVQRLFTTPQTPPHHSEGGFVSDGIIRALAGLRSLEEGTRVSMIEEFAREKSLKLAVQDLERTLLEQSASLAVYVLFHDIAKPEVVVLDAPAGSRGAREGFVQHDHRLRNRVHEEERQRFSKLFQAFCVQHDDLSPQEQVARFFDEYEVRAHYPKHAKQAFLVGEEVFEHLCTQYRLRERDKEMVAFAVRHHMDAIHGFSSGDRFAAFTSLQARARSASLDAGDVFDFLLAAVFLDACVGSLPYEEGVFSPNVDLVLQMMRTESEHAPHRQQERLVREQQHANSQLKQVLKETKLDGDAVFSHLKIPHGPKRGKIMKEIRLALKYPDGKIRLSVSDPEILERIESARLLLTQAQMREKISS